MPIIVINYWAVIASVVASMIIGFLWYGPLFSKAWMKEVGKSEADMKKTDSMGSMYALTTLAALVEAYVLAHFIGFVGADTIALGAATGFWAWFGFVATSFLSMSLFEGRSWKLYFINVGYHLVVLLVMGVILSGWR